MQLRVLTLNCWGLWLVAKRREERLRYAVFCVHMHAVYGTGVLIDHHTELEQTLSLAGGWPTS